MAYEHLVTTVIGRVIAGELDLTWSNVDDTNIHARRGGEFSFEAIGAIETWLAQPKPPTARERAESVARYMHEHGLLTHISGLEYSVAVDKIVTELEAAEAAAREAKSVNSPD